MKNIFDPEVFANVEEMIRLCAHSAVRDTRIWFDGDRPLAEDINPDFGVILKLIGCYKESTFAEGTDNDYKARVDTLFRDVAVEKLPNACRNQVHYDLILPVLMFYFIMKNESNPESIAVRVGKNKEKQKRTGENIRWSLKIQKEPLKIALARKNRKEASFARVIASARSVALKENFDKNELIPDNVKEACMGIFSLEDQYEKIQLCSEYARAGCFLRKLLVAADKGSKPLDTILRLYMIAELHEILTCTRFALEGVGSGNNGTIDKPLEYYVNVKRKQGIEQRYPIQCVTDSVPERTKKLLNQTKTQKERFLKFYKHLNENYVFDTPDILDFFLDNKVLEPCIGAVGMFEEYAKAAEKLIDAIPYLEETEKAANTVSRLVHLFREDQVEASWRESDDYSIMQEVEDILRSEVEMKSDVANDQQHTTS